MDFILSPESSFLLPENLLSKIIATGEGKTWIEEVFSSGMLVNRISAAKGIRFLDTGLIKIPESSKYSITIEEGVHPLLKSVINIKGCGDKTAEKLNAAGIRTIHDLLWIQPYDYRDIRNIIDVKDLEEGKLSCIHVKITKRFFVRGNLFADASDDTGAVKLNWFRIWPGLSSLVSPGVSLFVVGSCVRRNGILTFSHPDISTESPGKFLLKYSTIREISAGIHRRLVLNALEYIKKLPEDADPVPLELRKELNLPVFHDALEFIHNPPPDISEQQFELLSHGHHNSQLRFAFEELLWIQLAMLGKKNKASHNSNYGISIDSIKRVLGVLPFELTPGQNAALEEISSDLGSGKLMNRLLQGDVGSGKTAVAFAACAITCLSGFQCAFMVPTTVLAAQQYEFFSTMAEKLNLRTALLTSDIPVPSRKSILAMLEGGYIDILIGTQSLIQESVVFQDLALVVIDEQHRFGVSQRAALREKSGYENCHLLVMTATPIPRSLALTAYGDLDISVINGMPPGRMPVKTRIIKTKKEKLSVLEQIDNFLKKGEKVFVVVPLIDGGEEKERPDLGIIHDFFRDKLEHAVISELHGRMSFSEKEEIVGSFRDGKCNLIIATTVIEVGMDIPDASVIVIIESDRFGLSQLHQLRGRVGRRANADSRCYLMVSAKPTADGLARLKIMESTSDGFEISESDLRMRGPGDIIGTRQSGALSLKFGSILRHRELITIAREKAQTLLEKDPALENYTFLKNRVSEINIKQLIGPESG
ncbi:MAG: ATP-dependent DNA helicase RecG [Deltaproteobacteria bacterium]|nr:ATP-dependent DNA helicase RecG [Deltaproteobacteria bacterium]